MKDIKSACLVLLSLFCFSHVAHAGNGEKESASKVQIKKEIHKMMKGTDISYLKTDKASAIIEFVVNANQEVVVLDVTTASTTLEDNIKEKLNYKELGVKGAKQNMPYRLKVTFVKKA